MPLDPLKYLGKLIVKAAGVIVSRNVKSINFTGAGQTTTSSADEVTVDIPGGGGGGTPAGNDQEIQFNDSGSFGSDSNFKYDASNTQLKLNGGTLIKPDDAVSGDDLLIEAGDGSAGNGGDLELRSGNPVSGNGGDILVEAAGGDSGKGGDITIQAGEGDNDDGGGLSIIGGGVNGDGRGGDVSVVAGAGGDISGDGGDLILEAGRGDVDGSIILGRSRVPSLASDTGTAGAIAWDSDYFYVCVATDTWKRAALTTW